MRKSVNQQRLDEIRERVLATDPPPWTLAPVHQEGKPPSWTKVYGQGLKQCEFDAWGPRAEANAHFLARAREDVPWLLQEIEWLQQDNANLRTVIENERAPKGS